MNESSSQLSFAMENDVPKSPGELSALLGIENASIFVILDQSRFKFDQTLIDRIRFNLPQQKLVAEKALRFGRGAIGSGEPLTHYIFALEGKAVEGCRDKLKEIYFDYFLKQSNNCFFDLSEYVHFISPSKKASTAIIEHTFVHGIGRFYRFLFDIQKLKIDAPSLRDFLKMLPQNCPNHLFLSGPKASKGDWAFPVAIHEYSSCDLIILAQKASNANLMKRAHENIEKFLITNDPKTFACEIPIWLQPSDFDDYQTRFKTSSCITGHIDILRIEEDGRLGLWDYKPKARSETAAASQVWFYVMMLSKRTGIPTDKIQGGYFDESDAYLVNPKSPSSVTLS